MIINGSFQTYMNEIIININENWSWTGLIASNILKINNFGNIIVQDTKGTIWRIIPEDLSCLIISENIIDFEIIKKTEEFSIDWEMENLIELASSKFGLLSNNEKYCLKIPSILGGTYTHDNLGKISFSELISASGNLARQIKDMPDGTEVKLLVTD